MLGCVIRETYEDAEGKAFCLKAGYDEIRREYDASRRLTREAYYAEGNPVLRTDSLIAAYTQSFVSESERPGSITTTSTKKARQDWRKSHDEYEAFAEKHLLEFFTEEHISKINQAKIKGLIGQYIRISGEDKRKEKEDLRQNILAVVETKHIEMHSFSLRLAVKTLRIAPFLLQVAYPVYFILRRGGQIFFGRL